MKHVKKNTIFFGVILASFLMISSAIAVNVPQSNESEELESDIIYVYPGDSIQVAIDNASGGDTVFVYSGTYYENIVIDKSISLIGEDKDNTVINGSISYYVVTISADWVNISGFTIENSTSENYGYGPDVGIHLDSANYVKITDNNINNNLNVGIYLYDSSFNTIGGNNLNHNGEYGIALTQNSNNNLVMDNIVNNTIFGGILIFMSHYNNVVGNTVVNTAINYTNSSSLPFFGFGILIHSCSYNNILDNNLENNNFGIYAASAFSGDPTAFNTIAGNNIKNNNVYGIFIEQIHHGYVDNNLIYHNNLINNTENAYDNSSNIWYNETLQQGNYYDDYTGVDDDGDGIGDTPYFIPGGNNLDNYPLMNPYGWENEPPTTPIIDGETDGKVGIEYEYTFVSTDPEGDDVYYFIDWGDETNSGWIGPFASGEEITESHTWSEKGTYTIKAKAKDIHGAESDWATLPVTMPLDLEASTPSSQQTRLQKFTQIILSLINNIKLRFYQTINI